MVIMTSLRYFTESSFYCTRCGSKGIPVRRSKGKKREPGHLKKLFCLTCQDEVNHVEVQEAGSSYTYKEFKIEFEKGNFDKNGKRIVPSYKQFISERGAN